MQYAELFYQMHDDKVDKDKFINEAINWEYFPVIKDSKIVAFFVVKENRIHCACLKEYRKKWFPIKMYKTIVKAILDKYGKVVTTTYPETQDFVERLGFKKVHQIGNQLIFEKYEV
jgi:hypothetical protein